MTFNEFMEIMMQYWYFALIAVISVLVIIVTIIIATVDKCHKKNVNKKKIQKRPKWTRLQNEDLDATIQDILSVKKEDANRVEPKKDARQMAENTEQEKVESRQQVESVKGNLKEEEKSKVQENQPKNRVSQSKNEDEKDELSKIEKYYKQISISNTEEKKEVIDNANANKPVHTSINKPVHKVEHSTSDDKAPMKKATYSVIYDKNRKDWIVRKNGSTRATKRLPTKEEALKFTKQLIISQDANVAIHKKDGKFQKKSNVNM